MISQTLDLLFPAFCEVCRTELNQGRSICDPCLSSLPQITEPLCANCGAPFDGNLPEQIKCSNCTDLKYSFEFARAALTGAAQSFELAHAVKYRRKFYLSDDLASLMVNTWASDHRFANFRQNTLVVPVPLHWRRQQQRHSKHLNSREVLHRKPSFHSAKGSRELGQQRLKPNSTASNG